MTWVVEGDVDLEDVDLAIGSKDGPEQEILGWLAVEAARAAGANVHEEIGAGGTAVVRRAQLSGLIGAYWEYTGTGWTRVLQQSDPARTANELYEAVRDRDGEQNQIDWLPPAPMNGAGHRGFADHDRRPRGADARRPRRDLRAAECG